MAQQSQIETSGEPNSVRHNELDYGLVTALENYKYVEYISLSEFNGDVCDSLTVRLSERADAYDIDAVIGKLVRDFPLEFEQTKNNQIRFGVVE